MTDDPKKQCIVCGDSIPATAIKCRHCGSYQNWRRFIDLGQGTIALLIALISVSTLAIEAGHRAFESLFSNPLAPAVDGKVLSLSLDSVELLFNNNGKSRVLLNEGALCRVPMLRKGVNLHTGSAELVRYPRREEVEGIFSVFYETNEGSSFLDPSSAIRITASRTSVLREEGLPIAEGAREVRPYCSVSWIGQEGQDDGDFWGVPVIDIPRTSDRLVSFPFEDTINARAGEDEPDKLPANHDN